MLGPLDAGVAAKIVGEPELHLRAWSAAAEGLPVETQATNHQSQSLLVVPEGEVAAANVVHLEGLPGPAARRQDRLGAAKAGQSNGPVRYRCNVGASHAARVPPSAEASGSTRIT